jgi:hypothetical protein
MAARQHTCETHGGQSAVAHACFAPRCDGVAAPGLVNASTRAQSCRRSSRRSALRSTANSAAGWYAASSAAICARSISAMSGGAAGWGGLDAHASPLPQCRRSGGADGPHSPQSIAPGSRSFALFSTDQERARSARVGGGGGSSRDTDMRLKATILAALALIAFSGVSAGNGPLWPTTRGYIVGYYPLWYPGACEAVIFPRSPLCAGRPASFWPYAPWNYYVYY